MRIDDWDIGISRRYIRSYLGSYKRSLYEDYHDSYGRDFYLRFLGLMIYIAITWR